MRKLLVFLLILVALPMIAQNKDSEHFKFLGIPICGTIQEFSKQLEEKGFNKVESSEVYRGIFDGNSAYLLLIKNTDLDFVYGVDITLNIVDKENSYMLNDQYDDLKIRLEHKYNGTFKKSKMGYDSMDVYIEDKFTGSITIQIKEAVEGKSFLTLTYHDILGLIRNSEYLDRDL